MRYVLHVLIYSSRRANSGLVKPAKHKSSSRKSFVLDTNVLIHDPAAATKFDDNDVRIPIEVIQELDRLKNEESDRGRASRAAQRNLLALLGVGLPNQSVMVPGGGSLSIVVPPPDKTTPQERRILSLVGDVGGDLSSVDNRIIAAALRENVDAIHRGHSTVLVTKDMAMALKATAAGLAVEDFRHDKVSHHEADIKEPRRICLGDTEMYNFKINNGIRLSAAQASGILLNDYVVLENGHPGGVPARHVGGGEMKALLGASGFQVPGGRFVRPLNLEQSFLIDALLDPSIELITVHGPAGTGKTFLAMACSLLMVAEHRYEGVSITRPNVAMGQDIGFLKGDLTEKMNPWLQGYQDAVAALYSMKKAPLDKPQSERKAKRLSERAAHGTTPRGTGKGGPTPPMRPYDKLVQDGILEIQAMTFLRGRSIPDRLFILDEAQNATPHQLKTVVTRMAKGGKLVLMGDSSQIDTPYLDHLSNGLVYVRARMSDLANVAHVVLRKGERSHLAELAAQRL